MAEPTAQPRAGPALAAPPADLAARAALVLVRPALDRVPGPARPGADRTTDAAQQPVVGRGQRRSLVTPVRPHLPLRPLWLCRVCAAPWPCATARLTLLREYAHDRVALLIYLGGLLHDAAGQLHTLNPQDAPEPTHLFDRFLGWAVPRRTGHRADEPRNPFQAGSGSFS